MMDIYAEIILDHFKNPRQAGLIEHADAIAEDLNPLCGDKVKVSLRIKDGKIAGFGFEGDGCAISVASTSIIGEQLAGLEMEKFLEMSNEEVLEKLGVPISPGRIKCALLGFSCIKKAITVYKHSHA
ncbi:iron-sulfur cluster assembly scaffold protein [Candidatus Peregrinibacteria bacterium]|nr:iron-sulfur cluster assembly scaffold protein [Candidatus Peregrinibacteria bacterium]